MYLNNEDKKTCSGCTACVNVCPVKAISMEEDEEGFLYPIINKALCINCKICEKKCGFIKKERNAILQAYGVKHKNLEERMTSRSGGVFVAISDYILNKEGSIYGVIQDEKFCVKHARAINKEQLFKFKGSKYVQSDLNDMFKKVKEDLKQGMYVLFSGTSCQVAGLQEYLSNMNKEKLLTVDLICHGTPSQKIFNEYLKYIEEKYNKKIKEFIFRDKSFGWSGHVETIVFENNEKITIDIFKKIFYGHNVLRPSCYHCAFANTYNRPADMTIADFWGVEENLPEFYDEKGVSLLYLNSEKGTKIFEKIKDKVNSIKCDKQDCINHTWSLGKTLGEVPIRKKFWEDYKNMNFNELLKKYKYQ